MHIGWSGLVASHPAGKLELFSAIYGYFSTPDQYFCYISAFT
jgi:hypothetical protein